MRDDVIDKSLVESDDMPMVLNNDVTKKFKYKKGDGLKHALGVVMIVIAVLVFTFISMVGFPNFAGAIAFILLMISEALIYGDKFESYGHGRKVKKPAQTITNADIAYRAAKAERDRKEEEMFGTKTKEQLDDEEKKRQHREHIKTINRSAAKDLVDGKYLNH